MQPLVSVLMTAYNREKYIAEAIESVMTSTYQYWELIIVDDHSADKTVEIARKYELLDARIKVYVNESNLGDYPNRNKAASYARGKYLKYVDSDDTIYPDCLSIMVEAMEKFPAAGLGLSRSKVIRDGPYPSQISSREAYIEHYLGKGLFTCGPLGAIILKEAFDRELGFSEERYLGDTEFWLRIGAKRPVVKIRPGLVSWRTHEGQEYKLGVESGYYAEKGFFVEVKMLETGHCPLEPELRSKALARLKQHHARLILSKLIKGPDFFGALALYRKSKLSIVDLMKGFKRYV